MRRWVCVLLLSACGQTSEPVFLSPWMPVGAGMAFQAVASGHAGVASLSQPIQRSLLESDEVGNAMPGAQRVP